jgi:hypothetical protein
MKRLVSVLVLLAVVGAGWAGDDGILHRLQDAGVDTYVAPLHGARQYYFLSLNPRHPDADLSGLCELRYLVDLSLWGERISDREMRAVSVLRLRSLRLSGPSVTDAGLRSLERMTGLQSLTLEDCPLITAEGVARLQKALPKCEIRH